MQRRRHLLLLAAFTGILTVTTLALLEGGLRIYQAVRHDSRYIVNDDILHHKLRSNVDIIDRTRDNPFHLITNSQGWPEANDVSLAKPTKTFRLFEVGDSNFSRLAIVPCWQGRYHVRGGRPHPNREYQRSSPDSIRVAAEKER
jgi:hypothetical protein